MPRRLLALVTGLALLLAGCTAPTSTTSAPPTAAAPTTNGPRCTGWAATGGTAVSFGPNGAADLVGIMFGGPGGGAGGGSSTGPTAPAGLRASTGIVFAHEADDTSCDWIRTAVAFARRGYRTLVFDFAGYGASPRHPAGFDADVIAAAAFLGGHGVTATVLIGASMGGTAVLAAAAKITPPVAGVVALSAPLTYGALGAGALPPAIPVLLLCGEGDTSFAADARSLDAMFAASQHRKLVLVDSAQHGYRLVQVDGGLVQAQQELDAFLAAYAPPA